jgi:uncharacterized protein (TIGR00156 family)
MFKNRGGIPMKKYTFFGLSCFMLFFSVVTVHGQGFTGHGSGGKPNYIQGQPIMVSQPITVSEARNLPRDSWVILTENIVNALPRDSYYTFRDSSGEIIIEIDWRVWRGLSFNTSDTVEICGELIINRRQILIEVKAITGIGGTNTRQGQAVTVNEVRNLPRDSWVILTGNIVNVLPGQGGRYYTFRDPSGEITVEIDRRTWRGLSAGTSDTVEISGELKINRSQYSIDVKAIRRI